MVYGEAMAVLSGDVLLNYAYETALRTFQVPGAEVQAAKALTILAEKDGDPGNARRSERGRAERRKTRFGRNAVLYL